MKRDHPSIRQVLFGSSFAVLAALSNIHPANATDIANIPMAVSNLARPNIMFMLDSSGSMSNIVPDTPYDSSTTYLASCPNILAGGETTAALAGASTATFDLRIKTDGTVNIRKSSVNYVFGTGSGQQCFDPNLYYNAKLNADLGSTTATSTCGSDFTPCYYPSGYLDAVYKGNYLNWYFGASPNYTSAENFGANATRKSGTLSRMEIARTASKAVLDSLDRVRVGLFTYNSGNGGTLLEVMGDLDTTKRTNTKAKIDTLTASGATPLAETLADIGKYFVTGYTGNLTLHPSQTTPVTQTVANIFPHAYNNGSGVATPSAPIQYFCQKSFAVLMTDGRPQSDQSNISTDLQDYDGDCSGSNASNCNSYDQKKSTVVRTDGLTYSYESAGSDYLDDIAQALYEVDLRPDLTNPSGAAKKNNIATYAIGFADDQVLSDPLLTDTGTQGGGQFLTANNSATLVTAFQQAADDILSKDGSAAAVAVANANITSSGGNNASYVSSYNSGNWTGDLIAYPIDTGTGQPDINNPIWNTGCIDTTAWVDDADHSKGKKSCSAQVKLDSATPASRKIVTLKDESSTRTPVQFQPNGAAGTTTNLSTTQQALLNSTTNPPGLTDGENVVKFLRGDRSLETTSYRSRTHLLADLVNSEPTVQREPFFSYADSCYSAAVTTGPTANRCASPFKTAKSSRTRMVYIGGNDGMLHAFNASNGVEEWAYVPRFTMSNLNNLSKKSGFTHKYTVDGTAVISDVDFGNTSGGTGQDWRTILVGGLGKGGRGYYALDITCPVGTTTTTETACGTSLTEDQLTAKVLWEFPSSDSSHSSHLLNVGYTFGKPVITKTAAYGWVVLVTSGYNNGTGTDNSGGNGHGYLYVLNAKTGAVLQAIDTGVGSAADPSGLAHIAAYAANSDINNTVDYAYGGDLKGNVWRFDLTDNQGGIVYTKTLLAILKDASSATQPVTTVPELASISINGADKRFVYVGTGQYLGDSDVATNQTQTMYGLIDDTSITTGPVIPDATRNSLQQQSLTTTTSTTRSFATTTQPDWATKKGWYVDLPGCDQVSGTTCTAGSERVTGDPVLALGALIFSSNIPSSVACVPGGSSWLNIVDYKTGGTLTGSTTTWSSQYLGNGLASRPVVIKLPSGAVKTLERLSDATTVTTDVPLSGSSTGTSRVSWRELIEQ